MAKDGEVIWLHTNINRHWDQTFLFVEHNNLQSTYNTSHSFHASVAYGTGVDITRNGRRTVNHLFPGVPEYQN